MEKDNEILEEQIDNEEDLLDFDLDDLSIEDFEEESSSPEPKDKIIELVDIVEKGEIEDANTDKDLESLLEDDQLTVEMEDIDGSTDEIQIKEIFEEESLEPLEPDVDLADLTFESEMAGEERPENLEQRVEEEIGKSDLEKMLEGEPAGEVELGLESVIDIAEPLEEKIEEEIGDEDLEKILEDEQTEDTELDLEDGTIAIAEPLEDLFDESKVEEVTPEEQEEPYKEELGQEIAEQKMPPEPEISATEPMVSQFAGMSEEKYEAIVARVVQDTVERVAREVLANVAEKVITEAIDALKKSLESASD
ncbi:MAG: hypothetical protein SV375_12220 [Thermodesulfobacteriota bacterium]|nr:hypothetical protein [Thermodesulfobacteriota bacterium]